MHYSLMDTLLWGSLYSCTSFFFFTSLSTFIDSWCVPPHLRASQKKTWKWVNYAVSWTHSTMSGCCGVMAIALAPNLLGDIILGYSELAYISACMSYGYFFHDTLDLIHNLEHDKGNHELVVHHTFALTSASLVVFTKTYIGYGVIALLIELHSSVLHSRVLFKMYNGPSSYDSKYYRWIKYLNMAFFFLFRFSALIYMAWGLWRDRLTAPNLGIYLFMTLAVGVIFFLSVLLFFRVFRSDFMTPTPQADKTFQAIKEGLVIPGVTPLPPRSSSAPSNNKLVINASSLLLSGENNHDNDSNAPAAKKNVLSLSPSSSLTSSSNISLQSLNLKPLAAASLRPSAGVSS